MRDTSTARRRPVAPHAPSREPRRGSVQAESPVAEAKDNTVVKIIQISPTGVKVIYR